MRSAHAPCVRQGVAMDAAELPIAVADAKGAATIAPATIIGSNWSHADVPDTSPETSTTENCGHDIF